MRGARRVGRSVVGGCLRGCDLRCFADLGLRRKPGFASLHHSCTPRCAHTGGPAVAGQTAVGWCRSVGGSRERVRALAVVGLSKIVFAGAVCLGLSESAGSTRGGSKAVCKNKRVEADETERAAIEQPAPVRSVHLLSVLALSGEIEIHAGM